MDITNDVGVAGSTLSEWLHVGQHYLNIVQYNNQHAKIEMLSDEKI
jgi:spore coat polysaccharide biosynthesis predicted glycosyltransferase SpsG